jgi:glycosyltransferase involved in cell wall biosynthesis
MKILFVISGLGRGGAEAQVILLSKALVLAGHHAGIYALSRRTERLHELEGSGVEVVVDDKRSRVAPGVLARLRRHIRASRPDVVHSFQCDADIYARLAAAHTGATVLNSERTDHQRIPRLQRLAYRLTAGLCDGVVANTHAGARFARRLHRLHEDRVHVLWNAIDLAAVDARLARSSQPAREIFPAEAAKRICMVATLKPENDYPLALRVLRRLVDEDPAWRLLCVGEEPAAYPGYKAKLLAERARLGLVPFVEFVGHRRDVVELIGSSELLLITAAQGGFPVVALEAMACGTPVVGTDYGELRRLLPRAEQVASTRSAHELARAVLQCHGRRGEIAALQRRWVRQHGGAPAGAAALVAIYSSYVARAGGATRMAGVWMKRQSE